MKYKEYKNLSYSEIAEEVLKYWKENRIFERSVEERQGKPTFTFYEGPPSANGTPGIHHVISRTVKDIFCRFKTMKGHQVSRKGGWDTHGLPVELQVEKELGITKEDIGKSISIEDYNQRCREAVMKFKDQWDDLTIKMGYWVDLDDPYITFDTKYIESVWQLLKKLFDKGLLYKGYTIQPYSPAAGSGLSSHELNQPGTYKNLKDTSVVAQFKVINNKKASHLFKNVIGDLYMLAWTTTPWTLPANSALAVGKNITYLKVKTFNAYTFQPITVILAKDRFGNYFNKKAENIPLDDYKAGDKLIPYEIIDQLTGKELSEIDYEQLMNYVPLPKPAFTVVIGDFVTTEEGTGIVHISKTFGADDYRTCVQYGIPGVLVKDEDGNEVPIVNKQGRYVKEISDFAGMFVKNEYYPKGKAPEKSLDVLIAIKLKEENKAFKVEKYDHSYPHCWRTDKPVLYYPLDSWFIKTTALKDRLVALNKTINWKPASTGEGRFGNWLENLVDWNLSRSRFWGTPLPIWMTEDKSESKCVGSIEALREEVKASVEAGIMQGELPEEIDLHRPYVDDIVLVSDSGKKMYREKDLIDVWFDSGAMPYAQWHYPFENEDVFKNNYPADFIAEGVDQTRGWFFTLHAIAGILFESVAFKNVIANGLVLDKSGNKMSKRLGNAINPFETLAKYGPDATRWYMISNANPWDNLKFDLDGITEVQRRFFGTLQNTYAFFALYANLDQFNHDGHEIPYKNRRESDRWILSKLNSLITNVNEAYEDYEPTRAARSIQNFTIDDLSNWYVRLNRKRFWMGDYNEDKKSAYETLFTCLNTIAKLAAPIAPFYMDRLWQDLNTRQNDGSSVHLADFPSVNEDHQDFDLEEKMSLAQNITSLVHSLRKKEKIKVRQPLSKILIPILDEKVKHHIDEVSELIKSEINIKAIEYIGDDSDIVVKQIKPNFRILGQKFGPKMKAVTKAINQMGKKEIARIEKEREYKLQMDEEEIVIALDEVEIISQDIPGWLVTSQNGLTVAMDITITDSLRKEGLARDFVNRIQNLRKDEGLDVQDKINIEVSCDDELITEALNTHMDYICRETQAVSIEYHDLTDNATALEIDNYKLIVRIDVCNVTAG